MSTLGTAFDVEAVAEYADARVRTGARRGSLVPVSGRSGVNAWLYARWGNRGNAVYTAIGTLLTIGTSGLLAWLVQEPLLFPSLGATAFLLFETPMAEVASPRNTVVGHVVGALVASSWLLLLGLQDEADALVGGVEPARAAAVALSVACTGGLLRLLRAAHPPAGATTVIVSMGLLHTARELLALVVGVLLLALSAHVANRLLGVPAPRWASPR